MHRSCAAVVQAAAVVGIADAIGNCQPRYGYIIVSKGYSEDPADTLPTDSENTLARAGDGQVFLDVNLAAGKGDRARHARIKDDFVSRVGEADHASQGSRPVVGRVRHSARGRMSGGHRLSAQHQAETE